SALSRCVGFSPPILPRSTPASRFMRCANESTSTRNDWHAPARVALHWQNNHSLGGDMSKISRRDLFKATLAAGLGASLPGAVRAHGGAGRDDDDDDRGKGALVFV